MRWSVGLDKETLRIAAVCLLFFFFQAEDGIRDIGVTGVQTCALPIFGHFFYVRRSAVDLVGDLDMTFSPGYGEEVDFSQRCILRGLQHVLADDVLVFHSGGGSLNVGGHAERRRAANEETVNLRYPYYQKLVEEATQCTRTPLARSLAIARRAMVGMTVAIDGRTLGAFQTGTQIHTLELIAALSRTGRVRIRVVVPSTLGDYARDAMSGLQG